MLWPLKIDASASDGSVRLLDTLILDTTCLPIPPSPPPSSTTPRTTITSHTSLLRQTIQSNALFLTATLISDMECYGITRINKTYIGRVKLWDAAPHLYAQVLQQITCQLEALLTTAWNGQGVDIITPCTARSINNSIDISHVESENHHDMDDDDYARPSTDTHPTTSPPQHLIPIHLRLRDGNTYLVDDFNIDPSLLSSFYSNPFIIASTIVRDLNLKGDSWINSIAISILEQIYGLQVEVDGGGGDTSMQGIPKGPVPTATSNAQAITSIMDITKDMTAAWMIRAKEETASRDIVVDHYRITNSK